MLTVPGAQRHLQELVNHVHVAIDPKCSLGTKLLWVLLFIYFGGGTLIVMRSFLYWSRRA